MRIAQGSFDDAHAPEDGRCCGVGVDGVVEQKHAHVDEGNKGEAGDVAAVAYTGISESRV